jgi:hypothetical protein
MRRVSHEASVASVALASGGDDDPVDPAAAEFCPERQEVTYVVVTSVRREEHRGQTEALGKGVRPVEPGQGEAGCEPAGTPGI